MNNPLNQVAAGHGAASLLRPFTDEVEPSPQVTEVKVRQVQTRDARLLVPDSFVKSLPDGNLLAASLGHIPSCPALKTTENLPYLDCKASLLHRVMDFYQFDRELPQGLNKRQLSLLELFARRYALPDLQFHAHDHALLHSLRQREQADFDRRFVRVRAGAEEPCVPRNKNDLITLENMASMRPDMVRLAHSANQMKCFELSEKLQAITAQFPAQTGEKTFVHAKLEKDAMFTSLAHSLAS